MNQELKAVSSLALLYAIRMLGLFMVLPVMVIYGIHYRGATPELLGLALGIYGLTQACFQIPLGFLSDIVGRKPIIIGGLLLFAAGSIVAALSDSVWGLIVGRALQGAGAIASTIMALVSDLTSERNRTKAMAAIGASIGLSFAVAVILGPALAAFGGLLSIFILTAFLALLGIAIVHFLIPSPKAKALSRDAQAVPSLVNITLKNPELARLNSGIFVLHMVLTAMFVAVPWVLVERGSVAQENHWLVYLPVLLVSFVVALPFIVIAEKKQRVKEIFLLAILVLCLALSFLSLSDSGLVIFSNTGNQIVLMLFVFFVAFNLLEAMLPSLVSKLAPAGSKGTAMGIYSTSQFLGAFFGGAGGGLIMGFGGASMLFAVCACVVALWLFIAVFMARPKSLASLSFFVTKEVLEINFHDKEGVEDVVFVEDTDTQKGGTLYLKFDKSRLAREKINAWVEPYICA